MFYPDPTYRLQIRKGEEIELRQKFSIGTYLETEKIVEILNFLYNYHYNNICDIICGINTKTVVKFLLYQFDLIERRNNLDNGVAQDVVLYKETMLFLLDLIVEIKPCETSGTINFYENEYFNRLWIHAENAIEYSSASNLTHRVCKEKTRLEILPKNSEYFIKHEISDTLNDIFLKFSNDVKDNITLRNKYLNRNDLQNELLNVIYADDNIGFKKEFGVSFQQFEFMVLDIIKNCKDIDTPEQIPCLSDSHMDSISKQLNISREKIERLFNGITLNESQFKVRKREIWDYVQQERSRKRPLIQINYNGKDYRLFSPKMLGSRICYMGEDIILSHQNRLPHEWNNSTIKKNLAQSKTKIGNWFEHKTIELLRTVNIVGIKTGNKISVALHEIIKIDSKIGAPDFIGYSQCDNAIIIIECKLLDCVFESKGIQGELSKFLKTDTNKKNYVEKFKDKIDWISENKQKIKQAIEYQCSISIPKECNIVKFCFVTYYPTILRYFYKEIPSPTLFELVDLYTKQSRWPFEFGQIN